MKTWRIPLAWEMAGICVVEANTLEEAIEEALAPETPLPEGDYMIESCVVACDDEEYVREFYNDGQKDDKKGETDGSY